MPSLYERMREFGNQPLFRPDIPDAASGAGGWNRFWTGFRQGINPSRAEALARGPNLGAYAIGGLSEGLQDWWRGSGIRQRMMGNGQGAPLPSWMNPGFPGADALNAGPPRPAYTLPDFSGLMPPGQEPNDLYGRGQGMMRAPSAPVMPTRGVGTRGGEVVARGQAARDFVGGLRDSMNQQNLQNQARNAMENMFRGSER